MWSFSKIIWAKKSFGKSDLVALALFVGLVLTSSVQAQSRGKTVHRLALVIANSDYGSRPWGVLNSPLKDGNDISKVLKSSGYDVQVGLNLTKSQMSDAIGVFTRKLRRLQIDIEERRGHDKESIVAFFYFTGHGLSNSFSPYFVGLDSGGVFLDDVLAGSVNASELMERLSGVDGGVDTLSILFIDACRQVVDLPPRSPRSPKGINLSKSAFGGLVGKGMLVVLGSGEGRPSYDGRSKNENSIFTQAIMESVALADKKPMPLADFASTVKRRTIELSKANKLVPVQVPEIRDNIELLDAMFSEKSAQVSFENVAALNKGWEGSEGGSGWIWVGNVKPEQRTEWARANVSASAANQTLRPQDTAAQRVLILRDNLIVRNGFPGLCSQYPECTENLGALPEGYEVVSLGETGFKKNQMWLKIRFEKKALFKATPSNPRSKGVPRLAQSQIKLLKE